MGRPRKNPDQPKAPSKPRKKSEPVDKQKALEDILFDCRNKLRGNANMTTKRDMLLTLVFLRFIGSRYNEQREKIQQDGCRRFGKPYEELTTDEREFVDMMLQRKQSYQKDGVFFLKDEYNWDVLNKLPASERATKLDSGITALMSNEKDLKNALPANLFVNARLDPAVLKGVMDDITKIDPRNFKDIDLIGRVYEYFLQQFAVNATKEDGEFYTPQSIVELIANLIEPFDGTIYDPCCGSGGMFVQSIKLVEAHGGNKRNVSVYGQESDPDTYRLAKMNLAARGISFHLGDINASSFTHDQHPGLRSKYIMANPPFNKHNWWTGDDLSDDVRWKGYGTPPTSNANYAWILHMLYHLDKTEGIAGFLLSNGALDDSDTIEIRKKLIENDKVEAIFILPRDMFYGTDNSVSLWILNQNKEGGVWHGKHLTNRKGQVLFVDLRKWNTNVNTIKADKSKKKTFVVFSDSQIQDAVEIFRKWQTKNESVYEQIELYRSVSIKEIEQHGWSLVPSRYIRFKDRTIRIPEKELKTKTNTVLSETKSLTSNFLETLQYSKDRLDFITSLELPNPEVLGKYVEVIDERNLDRVKYPVFGMNKDKVFMPTKANMLDVDITKYKIVRNGMFAFSGMQTGRDECIRIALYQGDTPIMISPAYIVFKINDTERLLPEYLYLFFNRPEMDRYGWFISDSSVRSNLDWERFLTIEIPIPDIDIQKATVGLYNCAEEARRISAEAEKLSKVICPALLQHFIKESI